MLVLMVIALLAAVLIERRLSAPRPVHLAAKAEPLPGLRRVVLDPCTGLEKRVLAARDTKSD